MLRPQPILGSRRCGSRVAATAPLGADVLERLAAQARDRVSADPARRAAGSRPQARARRRRRRPPSGSGSRCCSRSGSTSFDPRASAPSSSPPTALLIPEALLDRALWLNVHPSLLPRWRGAAPIERALMAGDERDGRHDHRARAGARRRADRGAASVPARRRRTTSARSRRAPAELAAELLERGARPSRPLRPQADEGVTYAEKIGPEDRELDWSRPPQELLNRIRALSPHIGARGELHGRAGDDLARAGRGRRARAGRGAAGRRQADGRTTPSCAACG